MIFVPVGPSVVTPSPAAAVAQTPSPSPSMNPRWAHPDRRFWELVEAATAAAPVTAPDGDDGAATALARQLRTLPTASVVRFDEQLVQANRALYTTAVGAAGDLLCGPLFDDDFTDFRSWVVLHGQALYERVLADPGSLADLPGGCGTGELFAATAEDVYRQRTGRDLWQDRPDLALVPDDAPAGPPVSAEEARRRWPRLAAAGPA